VTLCGWEDNRRSGIALAVRYSLQWSNQATDSRPMKAPLLHSIYGTLYLYLYNNYASSNWFLPKYMNWYGRWAGKASARKFHTSQCKLGIERVQACRPTRWHFAFSLCCHSNATRAAIANPPNSVQLTASLPLPQVTPGPCSSVSMLPRIDRQTYTQTDARDHYTFRVVYDSREM